MYQSWGVSFIGLKSEKRSDPKSSSYPSTPPPPDPGAVCHVILVLHVQDELREALTAMDIK